MNINLEYYKVFYYVCQEGSLTAAAQRLCISQPAVSQAVRQLEKEAGTKLISRTSKGVLLTREGELLYHYVKGGVEQLLEGGRMLKRMLDMDMGEVRIGASDMTLQFFLLPYLEQFHKEYPKIKVTVTNAPTPETIRCLEEGKIDFGVVTTPFSGHGAIHSTEVKPIDNVLQEAALKNCRGKSWTIPFSVIFPVSSLKKIPAPACLWISFYPRKALN